MGGMVTFLEKIGLIGGNQRKVVPVGHLKQQSFLRGRGGSVTVELHVKAAWEKTDQPIQVFLSLLRVVLAEKMIQGALLPACQSDEPVCSPLQLVEINLSKSVPLGAHRAVCHNAAEIAVPCFILDIDRKRKASMACLGSHAFCVLETQGQLTA
jgi:hypothetical protein